jgi:DMSO/TMAO reductase YedYZ heme-binding membrane subunit
MLKDEQQINKWAKIRFFFYLLFLVLYLIPIAVVFIDGFDNVLQFIRRIVGLTGLTSLFITILLSLIIKESKKIFGINYLKIHHFFAAISLVSISVHPVIVAVDFGTTSVFIPKFNSWNAFLTEGGRFALYLIYFAVIVAILRKNIKKYWKYIHYLLYPAFLLTSIHGILRGSDSHNRIMFFQIVIMVAVIIIIFFYKRYQNIKKAPE